MKLRRIKTQYPKHYKKIKDEKIESIYSEVIKNESER